MRHLRLSVWALALIMGCHSFSDSEVNPYLITVDAKPWIENLTSDDLWDSDDGETKLLALGELALPALETASKTGGAQQRLAIAELASKLDLEFSENFLIELANDDDTEVREAALLGLQDSDDERVTELAEEALGSPSYEVRKAAAAMCADHCKSVESWQRLAELVVGGMEAAKRPLRILLSRPQVREKVQAAVDGFLRRSAQTANEDSAKLNAALMLALYDKEVGLPLLHQQLRQGPYSSAKITAIGALHYLGDASSVSFLEDLVERSEARSLSLISCKALKQLKAKGFDNNANCTTR